MAPCRIAGLFLLLQCGFLANAIRIGTEDQANKVAEFDHVLVDIDGTVNIHHPEQVKYMSNVYHPKDNIPARDKIGSEFTEDPARMTEALFGPSNKTQFTEGLQGAITKWRSWRGSQRYSGYIGAVFPDGGVEEAVGVALNNIVSKGNPQYWVAPTNWSAGNYQTLVNELAKVNPALRRFPVTDSQAGAAGGGYVKKMNRIRAFVGCSSVGCDSSRPVTNAKSGTSVESYSCSPAPDCPKLERIMVVDDCPFTMAALRVHLGAQLPGLRTVFVVPHMSLALDIGGANGAIQAAKSGPGSGDGPAIIERDPWWWYNQYSNKKPAMGADTAGVKSSGSNPRVGQAVYVINS